MPVSGDGSKVAWAYHTRHDGYDIQFSVHFAAASIEGEAMLSDDTIYATATEVMGAVRGEKGEGVFVPPQQGVVILRFDNSYVEI